MRKRVGLLILALGLFVSGVMFTSCSKEAECKAIITVRALRGAEAAEALPGCTVSIGSSEYSDSVNYVGVTDANGQIIHTWKNEAKLKMKADYNGIQGTSMLTLVKGETVEQEILVPMN